MTYYIIIEIDAGYSVASVSPGETPEAVAKKSGAILIDDGPYESFEEARDVLMMLPSPTVSDAER